MAPPPVAPAPAPIAARFAPPVLGPIAYRQVKIRPGADAASRVTLDQAIRFQPADDGWIATTIATGHAVDGPDRVRSAVDALLAPFEGVPVRVRLDRDGVPGAVTDGEASWAGVIHAFESLLAGKDGRLLEAERQAAIRATLASYRTMDAEGRDATLRGATAALLPPPLPALRVGESRPFASRLATPAGMLAAAGTTTLVGADAARIDYAIELATAAGATDAAVAQMLASLPPDPSPARRAAIEAGAATLRGARFVERTTLSIDRATGLLLTVLTIRSRVASDGSSREIERSELTRIDGVS